MKDKKIDQGQFIDRWAFFAIPKTSKISFELFGQANDFKKVADEFYFSIAKLYPLWRKIRPCLKQYIYPWLSKEEKAVLSHPIGKMLKDIWLENIEGKKYGFRVNVQENIEFLKYMFKHLNIAHDPVHSELYENYQGQVFSLRALRPNVDAHIYIRQSFAIRPIKKFIRQYFEMAVITGSYEFLLERFPPYYHSMMPHIHVAPGQRTALDFRKGFDFPPIIYKLPMKYNLALELDKVQTRSENRFITCPIINDPEAEKQKQAEIKQLEGARKGALPNFSYVGNVDFKYGKVWYGEMPEDPKPPVPNDCIEILAWIIAAILSGVSFFILYEGVFYKKVLLGMLVGILSASLLGFLYKKVVVKFLLKKQEIQKQEQDREEIEMYGPRRVNFLKFESEIKLLKANPVPGADSGLIIRFQLLHPVAVFLEGINRERPVCLKELEYVWKVLDLQEKETKKPEEKRKKIVEIIQDVFANPDRPSPKDETNEFLNEIKRLQKEYPTEEKSWNFLIDRLLEGKARSLLQAICFRFIGDVFELIFSLWPLLTGKEISIDQSSGEIQIKDYKEDIEEERETQNDVKKIRKKKKNSNEVNKREIPDTKKSLLPLIETLRNELEDLLRNVFSKYLDISAATNRARTVPRLAGMIVEYCINVKKDPEKFKQKLRDHLSHHYEVHYQFLKEYIKSDDRRRQSPSVLGHIHKLKLKPAEGSIGLELDTDKINKQIENDVEGIIELINAVRERLYSPTGSLRLLCFIDPQSIDIQIGDFFYEGKGIAEEDKFIANYQELQYELAKAESAKRAQVEQFDIERKGNKQMIDMKLQVLKVKENYAQKEAESLRRIKEVEIDKVFTEAKYQAIEQLKQGNIKEYGILSLIKAHQEGGIDAVEKLLTDSPNIVMAINPELYTKQAMSMVKKKLVAVLEKHPDKIDKITMAMLLKEDFKDIVAKDIYQEINKIFVDILQKSRIGFPMPMMSGGMARMPDMLMPSAGSQESESDKKKDKNKKDS